MRKAKKTLGGTIALVLAIIASLFLGGNLVDDYGSSSNNGSSPSVEVTNTGDFASTLSKIDNLRIDDKPRPDIKYNREDYKHWSKVSTEFNWPADKAAKYKNCTTRNAVLIDQGKNVSMTDPSKCKFTVSNGGGWDDIYGTAENGKVTFEDRIVKSRSVDIDHIVPLKEIWRSGGWKLSEKVREQIANDYDNLVPTSAKTNRSKSDQSAQTYLPPSDYRCEYVRRYVDIKDRYDLTVTMKEKNRLHSTAQECGK